MENWDAGLPVVGYRWVVPQPLGVVLLVHGYGEHTLRYEHVIAALNDAGLSVYAYDQRGHGRSEGPRALTDLPQLTDDHLAVREQLRRIHPGLPTFALGHSMGGLVTAASVLRDPRGLSGVVLSAPAFELYGEFPRAQQLAVRVLARVAPRLPLEKSQPGVLSRRPDVIEAFQNDPLCYSRSAKAKTVQMFAVGFARHWAQLARWRLPTLVIHGDADRLITVEGSRRFVREIASEDKELWEVPGGYHELFNDLDSDAAIAKVAGWIGERASRVPGAA